VRDDVAVVGEYDPDAQVHGAYLMDLTGLTKAEKIKVLQRYDALGHSLDAHFTPGDS